MNRLPKVAVLLSVGAVTAAASAPSASAGLCPPGTTRVDASEQPETDRNENGDICRRITPNKNIHYTDDSRPAKKKKK